MNMLAALLALLPVSVLADEIVLKPGSYQAMHINGRTGVSVRCSQPGACSMGPGTTIYNSDNVTIDGFVFSGGHAGVTIEGSNGVTVRNSTFVSQASSGVLVNPGDASTNVRIVDNNFVNNKTGCNYLDPGNCTGHLANGGVVSYMDYGARIYNCRNCDISHNTFGSIFNHAISLKASADNVTITDNTFNGCGRTCIELGQEWGQPSVGTATVSGNRLLGKFLNGIRIMNIRNAQVGSNIIGGKAQEGGDWGIGPPEPPYVYHMPVFEDPQARRQRILAEGGPGKNCCDDLSEQQQSAASARLGRLRQQWAGE